MPRDFTQERTRAQEAAALTQGLSQLSDAATRITAVVAQLNSLRARVEADLGDTFEQSDLDQLDTLTTRVAALKTAADAFLA